LYTFWSFLNVYVLHGSVATQLERGGIYRVAQKTSRTFACVIRPNNQNESTQKHFCNDRTSANMCKNFCL